tara:strand:+ start:311 stop:949 length:639 start_codon:yes stop_codon:yes gene_type:complete
MEFKFESYKKCLKFAQEENYSFVNLSDALDDKGRSVLLRHDIDFSLDHALKFAEIESSLGIQSTYFIRTHCKYYNAFSYNSKNILNNIESLGHFIGLHFEEDYYKPEQIYEFINFEKKLLDSLLSTPVNFIAPHEPTRTGRMTYEITKLEDIGIAHQAYDEKILKKYKYISDSSGKFRDGFMEEHLVQNKEENLYVLTHPVWWYEKTPVERY